MANIPDQSQLPSIFPPVVVSVGDVLGVGPEGMEYNQHFAGKTWQDVKPKHLERHTDAFSMMDRPSLAHYIAAFLRLALNEPNSNSAERLVYFAGSKEFLEFRDQLNPLQVAYVLDACEWIASDEYFSDDNRERIKTNRNTLADLGCA